jgi:hypothetical protein
MMNYCQRSLARNGTGQNKGIAQRKKKHPKHRTGALRNQRTANVCNRRSVSMRMQPNHGKITDGDSYGSKVAVNWGWSLYWLYPFISISFLAVMKRWTPHYTGMHCEALSTQSLDPLGNLVDFKMLIIKLIIWGVSNRAMVNYCHFMFRFSNRLMAHCYYYICVQCFSCF